MPLNHRALGLCQLLRRPIARTRGLHALLTTPRHVAPAHVRWSCGTVSKVEGGGARSEGGRILMASADIDPNSIEMCQSLWRLELGFRGGLGARRRNESQGGRKSSITPP